MINILRHLRINYLISQYKKPLRLPISRALDAVFLTTKRLSDRLVHKQKSEKELHLAFDEYQNGTFIKHDLPTCRLEQAAYQINSNRCSGKAN